MDVDSGHLRTGPLARQLVNTVYQALRANGYEGPAPEFGELWVSLFG
jgi:hypothetical protein